MKYVIVYWSRFGHGKKIVDTLADKLNEKGGEADIFKTDEVSPTSMPEADVYIFSTPTEAFNIQRHMRSFMKNLQGLEEKKYGIINTHGMQRNWLGKMDKILGKKNMIKVAEVDFQIGKDSKNAEGLSEGWESRINEFAEKL